MKGVALAFQEVMLLSVMYAFFSGNDVAFSSVDPNLHIKNGSNVFLFWWGKKGPEYLSQISIFIPTAGSWTKPTSHVQVLRKQ